MAFYVSGGGQGSIGVEKVKKKPNSAGKTKNKIRKKTHALLRPAPSRARTRQSRGWAGKIVGGTWEENYSPAEAESAFGGSSSSSPLGIPSAVDSTSRRNSSSEGEDPGAEPAPGAPAPREPTSGAANSVGTSWSLSARSVVSGLEESCGALEWPGAGD